MDQGDHNTPAKGDGVVPGNARARVVALLGHFIQRRDGCIDEVLCWRIYRIINSRHNTHVTRKSIVIRQNGQKSDLKLQNHKFFTKNTTERNTKVN